MAFGQSSGPPATGKQVQELLSLLNAAGHTDFRDARGPMGFTQRQAAGKFTRDEAESFIAALESAAEDAPPAEEAPTAPPPVTRAKASTGNRGLERIPTAQLAAELQRRGWIVMEP